MNKITQRQLIPMLQRKINSKLGRKKRGDCPITGADVYEIFVATLKEEICKGNNVLISEFGSFKIKPHKGHVVNLYNLRTESYLTLKFVPATSVNKRIRELDIKDYENKDDNNNNNNDD